MNKQEMKELERLTNQYEDVINYDLETIRMYEGQDEHENVVNEARKQVIDISGKYMEYASQYMSGVQESQIQKLNKNLNKLKQQKSKNLTQEDEEKVDTKIKNVEKAIKRLEKNKDQAGQEYIEMYVKKLERYGITAKDIGVKEQKSKTKPDSFIKRLFTAIFGRFIKPKENKKYKEDKTKQRKTLEELIAESVENMTEMGNILADEEYENIVNQVITDENKEEQHTQSATPKNTSKDTSKTTNQDKSNEPKNDNKPKIDEVEKNIRNDFKVYFKKVEEGYEDIIPKEYFDYKREIINSCLTPDSKKLYQEQNGFESIFNEQKSLLEYCNDALDYFDAEKDMSKDKKEIARKEKQISNLRKAIRKIEKREDELNKSNQEPEEDLEPEQNQDLNQEPEQQAIDVNEPSQDISNDVWQEMVAQSDEYFSNFERGFGDLFPNSYWNYKDEINDYLGTDEAQEKYKQQGFKELFPQYDKIADLLFAIMEDKANQLPISRTQDEADAIQAEMEDIKASIDNIFKRQIDNEHIKINIMKDFSTYFENVEKSYGYDDLPYGYVYYKEIKLDEILNNPNSKGIYEAYGINGLLPFPNMVDVLKDAAYTLEVQINNVAQTDEDKANIQEKIDNIREAIEKIEQRRKEQENSNEAQQVENEEEQTIESEVEPRTVRSRTEPHINGARIIRNKTQQIQNEEEQTIEPEVEPRVARNRPEPHINGARIVRSKNQQTQYESVAKFNVRTGKYTLEDENGEILDVIDLDEKLLNKKAKDAFALELVQRFQPEFQPEQWVEDAKAIAQNIDINLYRLYEKHDMNLAFQYLDAIRFENVKLPVKVVYDLRTKIKSEKVKTSFLDRRAIGKIAEIQEKYGIAQIEKDPKMSIRKKIAIALGIGASAATLTAGVVGVSKLVDYLGENEKEEQTDENFRDTDKDTLDFENIGVNSQILNNEKQASMNSIKSNTVTKSVEENKKETSVNKETIKKDKKMPVDQQKPTDELKQSTTKPVKENKRETFAESIHVDVQQKSADELEKEAIKQLENQIGIGSKAVLKEGTYYYDSEGNGPIGKMENRENKEVEINFIAVINENGKCENCLLDGNIERAKQLNEKAKIMVQISNKDGDLGWISFDDVKDKFVDYLIQEKQSAELVK